MHSETGVIHDGPWFRQGTQTPINRGLPTISLCITLKGKVQREA
jgi:hypothetical protein